MLQLPLTFIMLAPSWSEGFPRHRRPETQGSFERSPTVLGPLPWEGPTTHETDPSGSFALVLRAAVRPAGWGAPPGVFWKTPPAIEGARVAWADLVDRGACRAGNELQVHGKRAVDHDDEGAGWTPWLSQVLVLDVSREAGRKF
jgi:hypothetical protein